MCPLKKASVRLALACFECLINSIFFVCLFFLKKTTNCEEKHFNMHYWCQLFFGNGILICLRCQLNPLKDLNMMNMYEHVNET